MSDVEPAFSRLWEAVRSATKYLSDTQIHSTVGGALALAEPEDTNTEREKAFALADRAEAAMIEEYQAWKQSWERNPTLSALALGVNAIRALRKELES